MSTILILAEKLRIKEGSYAANDFVAMQISRYPSIRGLSQLIKWHIESAEGKVKEKLSILYELTHKLLERKPTYQCHQCGFSGNTLLWHCPGCKTWNNMKPIHGLVGD